VAHESGAIAGWARLYPWSPRPAYARTAENAVYVDEAFRGRGVGASLMEALIARARTIGVKVLIARVVRGQPRQPRPARVDRLFDHRRHASRGREVRARAGCAAHGPAPGAVKAGYAAIVDDELGMVLAIQEAKAGIAAGQSPFGAVIVCDGKVVGAGHNEVWKRTDITAHAEIVAIQRACSALNSIDLSGCTIYTTTEPCPMCASAIHWARIERCCCGATIADAAKAGFNELHLPATDVYRLGRSRVQLFQGVLRAQCAALFGSG
jgi:tRNA(Arg) A34 adenosine deaminase TadA